MMIAVVPSEEISEIARVDVSSLNRFKKSGFVSHF